jgi:poly(A) polymerase
MTGLRLGDIRWLTEGAPGKLLAALDRDGEEARVVGGAVRNALLGEPPREIDVATTARPEEVMRRADAAGFRAVPTGIEHGTVTIVVDGTGFEVTTLREDVETFGRKAKVRFGRDWEKDAQRRDFTLNALFLSRDGTVHDLVGGIEDLRQRRVRFIGDPARRIAEDYLRILRFFRFHAVYADGPPDAAGLHASILARENLRRLSRERVRTELLKLLVAPGAAPTLAVMADAGILVLVLGGVPYVASAANMITLETALGLAADPIRRLGALAAAVAEDAERVSERLRLANVEYERLASMADRWWRIDPTIGHLGARALLYRLGPARYRDRILLAWARCGGEPGDVGWRGLASLPDHWQAPVFPLKAADFMARGIAKGPQLGKVLAAAEEKWIAAGFPSDAQRLQHIVEETARH